MIRGGECTLGAGPHVGRGSLPGCERRQGRRSRANGSTWTGRVPRRRDHMLWTVARKSAEFGVRLHLSRLTCGRCGSLRGLWASAPPLWVCGEGGETAAMSSSPVPADVGATPAVGRGSGLPGEVTPRRTSFGDCAGTTVQNSAWLGRTQNS